MEPKDSEPIIIERKNTKQFEVTCDTEFFADLFESLIKRICQFPASYSKVEDDIIESKSNL